MSSEQERKGRGQCVSDCPLRLRPAAVLVFSPFILSVISDFPTDRLVCETDVTLQSVGR